MDTDANGTVVLRLVGAAALLSCAGGYGPIATSPEGVAFALLSNRPVRVVDDADFIQAVRSLIAERAMAGAGPDGAGVNWG